MSVVISVVVHIRMTILATRHGLDFIAMVVMISIVLAIAMYLRGEVTSFALHLAAMHIGFVANGFILAQIIHADAAAVASRTLFREMWSFHESMRAQDHAPDLGESASHTVGPAHMTLPTGGMTTRTFSLEIILIF